MRQLLKKEFSLCLHPAAALFIAFGMFVFIPNYPYEVMCFFSGLGVFFICLTARENGDPAFTCSLPVQKNLCARARILMCMILQLCQLVFAALCTTLKANLFPAPNLAGMDANLSLFGLAFLLLGVFNAIFFPLYFKNPDKVGIPFIIASVVVFLLIISEIVLGYTVPLFFEHLDTPDPDSLAYKFVFLGIGAVLYVGLTALAFILSERRYLRVDL